jgi:CheY-like chemotaxis protein
VCLAILLGIIWGIAPVAASHIAARIMRLKPSDGAQMSAFKTLKRFGFDKLVPVVAAFSLLFLMDVAKTLVVQVGDTIPPNVSYRYDLWFLQHSSDERLRCLWAHFDDAPTLNEFQNDVERALSEVEMVNKDSQIFGNLRYWTDKSGSASEGFSACKFFIAWAIMWALIEMIVTRHPARPLSLMTFCFVLFFIIGSFFLFRDVWGIEQEQDARLAAVEVFLFQRQPACRAISAEQQASYDEIINEAHHDSTRSSEHRWWSIRIFDSYYPHWIWQEISSPVGDSGVLPSVSSNVIGREQWTGGHLEETQERATFYLAKASDNREQLAEEGAHLGQNLPPVKVQSEAATTSIVKSAVTPSSLLRYAGKRILWVDDHPENNTYEVQLFKSLGMIVDQSTSTANALSDLSRDTYDVVITDMRRGTDNLAGYELLGGMNQRQIETPLFVYSASSNAEYRAQAMRKGAKGETNDPTELLQLVTGALLEPARH